MSDFRVSVSREARKLLSDDSQRQIARRAMKQVARMEQPPHAPMTFQGPLNLQVTIDWQLRTIRVFVGTGTCDGDL